jgi:hypothetical protein
MLLDTIIQSFERFQIDCQTLCRQHYPAVHNGGLTEHHLATAFARRLKTDIEKHAASVAIVPLDHIDSEPLPNAYRIVSPYGCIWVLAHHFVNGNQTSRGKLISLVQQWQVECRTALDKNDLLVVLADHWLSRCHQSRSLISWWCDELPEAPSQYLKEGVKLIGSNTSMRQELFQRYQLSPNYVAYAHPLTKLCSDEHVMKYVQLYAVISI